MRIYLLWRTLKLIGDVYVITPGDETGSVDQRNATFHISHGYLGNMFEGRLWRYTGKYNNTMVNPCYTSLPLNKWFPDVHFDFAVGRYFNAFNDVRPWKNGIPTIVDIDDHPLEKMYGAVLQGRVPGQSKQVMKLELAYLEYNIRGGWIVKDADRQYLGRIKGLFDLLPNIPPEIPDSYEPFSIERKPTLLTVALFSYPPNQDGVEDFLLKIWPEIKRKYPNME